MEGKIDVIGVEHQIMDLAIQINQIPKTDGVSLVKDICWAGGGNASSALVALARLGAVAAVVGTAGKDAYGNFCVKDMAQNGVDVSHLKQVDGETTLCICLAETKTQGRSFLGKMGTPAELTQKKLMRILSDQQKCFTLAVCPVQPRQLPSNLRKSIRWKYLWMPADTVQKERSWQRNRIF